MKRLALSLTAVAVVLVGLVLVLRRPAPDVAAPPAREAAGRNEVVVAAAAPTATPASRKLAELRAMSPTFLGSTLLIAIRNAGFVCDEVVGVDQSEPDSPVWRARCRDLQAYLVRVVSSGALAVEPTVAIWDGNFPPRPLPERPPQDSNDPFDLRR
jgi:hypothetical protein